MGDTERFRDSMRRPFSVYFEIMFPKPQYLPAFISQD